MFADLFLNFGADFGGFTVDNLVETVGEAQLLSLFDSGLLLQVHRAVLMLLEEDVHELLEEDDLVQQQRHVELLSHLLATGLVHLHLLPGEVDAEHLQDYEDAVEAVGEEVEAARLQRLLAVVEEEAVPHLHFEGGLRVELHEEDEGEHEPEEPSHVREEPIDLLEAPRAVDVVGGLPQVDVDVLVLVDFAGLHLGELLDDQHRLLISLAPRHQSFVSLDEVLREVNITLNCGLPVEAEVVSVFEVVINGVERGAVDEGVHEEIF